MIDEKVYAQLSARVYQRTDENKMLIPDGWVEKKMVKR